MDTNQAFEILGLDPLTTPEEIEKRFRQLATERHPDHGGANEPMSELNEARSTALTALVHSRAMVPIDALHSAVELVATSHHKHQLAEKRVTKAQEDLKSRSTGTLRQYRRVAGVLAAVASAAVFLGNEIPADFLHTTPTRLLVTEGEPPPVAVDSELQDRVDEYNRMMSRYWLFTWLSVAAYGGLGAWWFTRRIESMEHHLRDLEEETGTKTLLYKFLREILGDNIHGRWTLEELNAAIFQWQHTQSGPYAHAAIGLGSLRFAQYLMDRAQQVRLVTVREESDREGLTEYYQVTRTK